MSEEEFTSIDLFGEPINWDGRRTARLRRYTTDGRGIHTVDVRILTGHVLDKLAELPDESVHCVITSPPYYGLRDYGVEPQVWGGDPGCEHEWGEWREKRDIREETIHGKTRTTDRFYGDESRRFDGNHQKITAGQFCQKCPAWRGSLGLEPTPQLYVEHMVEVFREVRRVLRSDGTLWLNIGDSYAGSWGAQGRGGPPSELSTLRGNGHVGGGPKLKSLSAVQIAAHPHKKSQTGTIRQAGIKPKDLLGIPWMLAFALRDDGWWLRSEITWAKRAPMPESVTDRPTSVTEKVFLLTKSACYYYDAEAVKEDGSEDSHGSPNINPGTKGELLKGERATTTLGKWDRAQQTKRNLRNWWLLGPEPFPEAHFATFPTEIPRRAILAGTSEKGVCPKCGAPWTRMTGDKTVTPAHGGARKKISDAEWKDGWEGIGRAAVSIETIGWHPGCLCVGDHPNLSPAPATVLDPFFGAGTTGLVAAQLGRHTIGIDLNEKYARMACDRIEADTGALGYSQVTIE